jgi:hypothetical protein
MLSQVQGNSCQGAARMPPIYDYRSAGQSNNGRFKHEYAFVTGLRRDGWTRMRQDNDEIRMTKLEVTTNDQ